MVSVRAVASSLASLLVVASLSLAGVDPVAAADDLAAQRLDAAVALRQSLGLPADRDYVRDLISGPNDVGTDQVGIPLTAAEFKEVDIDGRVRFADRVARDVMPWLESRAAFAGAWVDQKDNGSLVVLLTRSDEQTIEGINARMPGGPRGWRLDIVVTSWADLEAALTRAFSVSENVDASARLGAATIDTKQNRLTLTYTPSTAERMESRREELAHAYRVASADHNM